MASEKAVGALLIVLAVVVLGVYVFWGILPLFFGANIYLFEWGEMELLGHKFPVIPIYWLLFVPIFLLILVLVLGLFWIGHALIVTPPIEEIKIEEIEKELAEEEKKEEKKEETEKQD